MASDSYFYDEDTHTEYGPGDKLRRDEVYILARVDSGKFAAICLKTGNRWSGPVDSMEYLVRAMLESGFTKLTGLKMVIQEEI